VQFLAIQGMRNIVIPPKPACVHFQPSPIVSQEFKKSFDLTKSQYVT
jgi:hypothetical protein